MNIEEAKASSILTIARSNDMSVAINIEHAKKAYGKDVIIPVLNVDIKDGELFTLLGSSGCGKQRY